MPSTYDHDDTIRKAKNDIIDSLRSVPPHYVPVREVTSRICMRICCDTSQISVCPHMQVCCLYASYSSTAYDVSKNYLTSCRFKAYEMPFFRPVLHPKINFRGAPNVRMQLGAALLMTPFLFSPHRTQPR